MRLSCSQPSFIGSVTSLKMLTARIIAAILLFLCLEMSLGDEEAFMEPPEQQIDTPKKDRKVKDLRLPTAIQPDVYHLTLRPNFYEGPIENFTFYGFLKIFLNCLNKTNVIKIHSLGLNISPKDISVWGVAGYGANTQVTNELNVSNVMYDKQREWHVIKLRSSMERGKRYLLGFKRFTGRITEEPQRGLFLRRYKEGNTTKYLVASQHEPTFARKSFPCFDEPAMKARFNVKLFRKAHFHSLSNMPKIDEEVLDGDWVADIYNQSIRMSTYQLAFLVSQYVNLTAKDSKGRLFSVWSRQEDIKTTNFSLYTAMKVMEKFEKYHSVMPYPIQKMDMVAIPNFFLSAMENWGLIFYNPIKLLFDPLINSLDDMKKIYTTIAHEIAHTWFGNLVTLKWWNDAWLNEGFSFLMESTGVDMFYPQWKYDALSLIKTHEFMKVDSLLSTTSVVTEVYSPEDIMGHVFSYIIYHKGSALLRMLKGFLGKRAFNLGLHIYLKKHSYKNVRRNDLWLAFSKAARFSHKSSRVKEVMDPWMEQKGYPILEVRKYNSTVYLYQKKFIVDPSSLRFSNKSKEKWPIPLTWTTQSECDWSLTHRVKWMNSESTEMSLPNSAANDWIIFNLKQMGFYRVQYQKFNWLKIIDQLHKNHSAISLHNRGQLLDDMFEFAKLDLVPYSMALNLSNYLVNETDYLPWKTALDRFKEIEFKFDLDQDYGDFRKFILSLLKPIYNRVIASAPPKNDLLMSNTRSLIISTACRMQHEHCLKTTLDLFRQWRKNSSFYIIPDLRETVYCIGIRNGNPEDWEFLLRHMKTTTNFEKKRLLKALSCTREPWILKRYLMLTLDSNVIEKRSIIFIIKNIANQPYGRYLVLDFIRQNLDKITAKNRLSEKGIGRLISDSLQQITNPLRIQDLENLEEEVRRRGLSEKPLKKVLTAVKSNNKWKNDYFESIKKWLKNRVSKSM